MANPDRNPKAEAAVERLKEFLDAKNRIRDEARGEAADETAEPVADRATDAAQKEKPDGENPARDKKGLFVVGNPGGPGRPRGSKNMLPRGSRKMMKELIAGRLTQDGRPIATIMVDLFFQGLQGGVVLRRNAKTTTYVSPVAFLKLFLDYMLKIREQALKAKAARKNSKGSGGGIRVVLLNPGTRTEESASSGPVRAQSPAPNPEDAFDPAELVADFEHAICECCMGMGWVRDENGIKMVKCEACEGAGRAPRQES